MKKIKLFEEFINESKGLELVHAYDKDGTMYGTGELVKKQGSKSLIRFDRDTEKWFDNKDVKLVESNEIDEATTSWSKMMKGVKAGESGPWSLVAIEYNKVVGQKNNIKIRDILPAEFEEFRKQYPKAKIHIEDGTGGVVWNESVVNEAQIGDKLTKKFTELTGISTWDKVTSKSESGTWTVARLWAPKDNGGMNPGLHIELTKGSTRTHFQAMDENGTLTEFGKELKKK